MDYVLMQEHCIVQQMVLELVQNEIAPFINEQDFTETMTPFSLQCMGELGL